MSSVECRTKSQHGNKFVRNVTEMRTWISGEGGSNRRLEKTALWS
jgi:hypothetical protein